jgi:hypothetical protein
MSKKGDKEKVKKQKKIGETKNNSKQHSHF